MVCNLSEYIENRSKVDVDLTMNYLLPSFILAKENVNASDLPSKLMVSFWVKKTTTNKPIEASVSVIRALTSSLIDLNLWLQAGNYTDVSF